MSATMTPPSPRTKRNSKAPNRFCSNTSRIEISSSSSTSPGETIIDYNDNSTSTTHNLVPTNRAIKLKAPASRDPLKVKLPKLKRSIVKEGTQKTDISTVKLSKIKLPFQLSSNRKKNETKQPGTGPLRIKLSFKKKKINEEEKEASPIKTVIKNEDSPAYCKPIHDETCNKPTGDVVNHKLTSELASPIRNDSMRNHAEINGSSGADVPCQSDNLEPKATNENSSDLANDSGIRCPCGLNVDIGVMVECERCFNWQHVQCINGGSDDGAYEGYICAFCCPTTEAKTTTTTGQSVDIKD